MKHFKIIKRTSLTYIILLAAFFLSLCAVYNIPRECIYENVKESSKILIKETDYYDLLKRSSKYYIIDNYTDAIMLNIAMLADTKQPIISAMLCNTNISCDDMTSSLEKLVNGEINESFTGDYGRYWHGYQVFLRPALTIFNLNGIRVFNFVFFAILLVLLSYLLYKKLNLAISLIFSVVLYAVVFPLVPYSMQFSTCFYICLISCLAILYRPKLVESNINLATVFFIIGGITSFLDLLTTPLITLGLPIIIANLLYKKDTLKRVSIGSIFWMAGYGIMWASKWILGYIITGHNLISEAFTTISMRTSSTIQCNYDYSIPPTSLRTILICIVAALWLFLCLYFFYCKNKHINTERIWLLVLSLYVPTWYVVVFNHSMIHSWFTWRSYIISVIAILIFIYLTITKYRNENSRINTLLQRKPDNR